MVLYEREERELTLEQAAAVVLITVFAVFIGWGRTRGGRKSIERIFGSRRGPDSSSTRRARGARTATSKNSPSSSRKRAASKRGRAR
jgi:hypothetical protein